MLLLCQRALHCSIPSTCLVPEATDIRLNKPTLLWRNRHYFEAADITLTQPTLLWSNRHYFAATDITLKQLTLLWSSRHYFEATNITLKQLILLWSNQHYFEATGITMKQPTLLWSNRHYFEATDITSYIGLSSCTSISQNTLLYNIQKVKVCSFVREYPVCRTAQTTFQFPSLADLFIPTQTWHDWEA